MKYNIQIKLLATLVTILVIACTGPSSEKQNHQTETNNNTVKLEKAQQITSQTQAVLGKTLMQAIQTIGVAGAVEFCNTKALAITDSMSIAQGVHIRRVSDKPRNSMNIASEVFQKQIVGYKAKLAEGKNLQANTVTIDGVTSYCVPIITNSLCLKCHGDTEIDETTRLKLNSLYPIDKATGYTANEVRGLWVVDGL